MKNGDMYIEIIKRDKKGHNAVKAIKITGEDGEIDLRLVHMMLAAQAEEKLLIVTSDANLLLAILEAYDAFFTEHTCEEKKAETEMSGYKRLLEDLALEQDCYT